VTRPFFGVNFTAFDTSPHDLLQPCRIARQQA
jgi:hypothetical protein